MPSYATWDDHDFGSNDSYTVTAGKENSLEAFKDLWAHLAHGTLELPDVFYRFRWAMIDIDTTARDPTVTARFFVEEQLDQTHRIRLSDLTLPDQQHEQASGPNHAMVF